VQIEQATADYIQWLADVRRRSPETITSYTSTLRQLAAWCDSEPTLEQLERFTTRQRRGRAPAAATIARDVNALRSFYSWAARVGLADNIATDLLSPSVSNISPRAIDDTTWGTLWKSDIADADRAWLGLGFFCGLRRAELLALCSHHLSVGTRKLVGFKRKGGGDHTVPVGTMLDVYENKLPHLLPDLLWPALEGWHESGGPLVDVRNAQQLSRHLDHLLRYVGAERFTPHALRHSAVTNLLRADVPLHLVSKLMNHTNMTTTLRYVRAGGDELAEWLLR